MVSDPNGTYLSANMATEGFSMQRAKLIVSFPRQRGVGMGAMPATKTPPSQPSRTTAGGNNHKGCAGSQTASRFM